MMKKTLLAACTALLLPALCAQAQTVTVDGIEYWLFRNSKTAKAASYYGNATEIAIPATVEYENTDYTVTTIGSGLFYDQRDLESVTLPSGITKIQSNAFGSCYSLTHIDLPEGLETIDFDAFMFSGLQGNIDLPEGLKEIGMQAFYDCSSLSSVTLPSTLEDREVSFRQLPLGGHHLQGRHSPCAWRESVRCHGLCQRQPPCA